MRLLFDQNRSPRLVSAFADSFPESIRVRDVGLERGVDAAIRTYAAQHGLAIVSKDSDFHQMSFPVWSATKGDLDTPWQLFHSDHHNAPAHLQGRDH